MAIKFRHLEAMRALLAGQTVTRAAEILGVTQPAMSRILNQLEQEVGVKLFARRGHRLMLTGNGEVFFREAQNVFASSDHLAEVAEDLRRGRSGVLRITTQSALGVGLVPAALAEFTEAFPKAAVTLQVKPREELDSWVASGHFDLGLGRMPIQDPGVRIEHFATLEASCIMPADHPLKNKSVIEPADLDGQTFISAARGTLLHYRIEEVLHRSTSRVRRIVVDTTEAAWGLVAAGTGVSIVHGFVRLAPNPLVVVRPFKPAIRFDYALIWPAGATPSHVANAFAAMIRKAADRCGEHWPRHDSA